MSDLLELARGLSVLWDEQYNGFVIAKARWQISEAVKTVRANVQKKRENYYIIEVQGYGHDNNFSGSLTVTLVKANVECGKINYIAKQQKIIGTASQADGHVLSKKQVEEYLQFVKDYNSIHRGENAIVPGLLLLDYIMKQCSIQKMGLEFHEIRFVSPLRVGEMFWLEPTMSGMHVCSHDEQKIYAKII